MLIPWEKLEEQTLLNIVDSFFYVKVRIMVVPSFH